MGVNLTPEGDKSRMIEMRCIYDQLSSVVVQSVQVSFFSSTVSVSLSLLSRLGGERSLLSRLGGERC